jgi:hypothetical protein
MTELMSRLTGGTVLELGEQLSSDAMPVICIAEDRASCEPAVRLLLMSLERHCGDHKVELFYPPANKDFRSWLKQLPAVNLNATPVPGAWGWNVKPHAILALFERGYGDVLWIDSDIVVAKNFERYFRGLPPMILVVTEEALYGAHDDPNGLRARLWGFAVGRSLPFTVNTGVLRATSLHANLLKRWIFCLEEPRYREAQRMDWSERPLHLYGDQDVLTALLASEECADVPIQFLRRGKDIIQFFGPYGYTVRERMRNMIYGMPPFIHSQVTKPWSKELAGKPTGWRRRFDTLYMQLSPYTMSALKYRSELLDTGWMNANSLTGKILRICGFSYPPLTGLPLAIGSDLFSLMKRLFSNTKLAKAADLRNGSPLAARTTGAKSRCAAARTESAPGSQVR